MFEDVSNYPLAWPSFWPRTQSYRRQNAQFAERSVARALDFVLAELRRLGATGVVVSSNLRLRQDGLPAARQSRVDDPGIAVYFRLKGEPRVLACDRWLAPEDNLWAIGKHIEALRGQQRWGVGTLEQAFAGYARLPESTVENWWTVLGVDRGASLEQVREAYFKLAKHHHPDTGGSEEQFIRVHQAWEQGKQEKGGGN